MAEVRHGADLEGYDRHHPGVLGVFLNLGAERSDVAVRDGFGAMFRFTPDNVALMQDNIANPDVAIAPDYQPHFQTAVEMIQSAQVDLGRIAAREV